MGVHYPNFHDGQMYCSWCSLFQILMMPFLSYMKLRIVKNSTQVFVTTAKVTITRSSSIAGESVLIPNQKPFYGKMSRLFKLKVLALQSDHCFLV